MTCNKSRGIQGVHKNCPSKVILLIHVPIKQLFVILKCKSKTILFLLFFSEKKRQILNIHSFLMIILKVWTFLHIIFPSSLSPTYGISSGRAQFWNSWFLRTELSAVLCIWVLVIILCLVMKEACQSTPEIITHHLNHSSHKSIYILPF